MRNLGYDHDLGLYNDWGTKKVVLGICSLVITCIVIALVAFILDLDKLDREPSRLYPWLLTLPQVILLITGYMLVNKNYYVPWRALRFNKPQRKFFFVLAVLAVPSNLLIVALFAALVTNLGVDQLIPPQIPKSILGGGLFLLVNLFALTVWVPLIEETFFRGFLLQALASRYGSVTAILIISLIFAISHLHVGVFVPVFFSSILISWLFVASKSIWVPILTHSLQNLIVSVVAASA